LTSNKSAYKENLSSLFEKFLKTPRPDEVIEYLEKNSKLPGPRANLELADSFAESIEELVTVTSNQTRMKILSKLCSELAETKIDPNSPAEFVSFCGVRGIGALGSSSDKQLQRSLSSLRKYANSDSWRAREAVAMSLQKLLMKSSGTVLEELESWLEGNNWLEMRAVAAATAEPALMSNDLIAKKCLEFQKEIIRKIARSCDRSSEQFKALRKALGYTLSVVAVAKPKESFALLREIIDPAFKDTDLKWIAKENLKKERITRKYPSEVDALTKLLN
jgi:hypothetical protein